MPPLPENLLEVGNSVLHSGSTVGSRLATRGPKEETGLRRMPSSLFMCGRRNALRDLDQLPKVDKTKTVAK